MDTALKCVQPNSGLLISVVLCNYNYGPFIGEAIKSVLDQTHKNFELIIVDDGSTDNSREIIVSFKDPRIQTLFKAKNGGQASSFNVGLEAAKGEYVAFLDSDDFWAPDKLEKVIGSFKEGISVVQHNLCVINRESRPVGRSHPGIEPGLKNVARAYSSENRCNFFSATSGITCRRKDLLAIFPINEEDWKICADVAITRPLALFGDVFTLKENVGYYRMHTANSWLNSSHQSQWIQNGLRDAEYTNLWLARLGRHERVEFTKSQFYRDVMDSYLPLYHPRKQWWVIRTAFSWIISRIVGASRARGVAALLRRILMTGQHR